MTFNLLKSVKNRYNYPAYKIPISYFHGSNTYPYFKYYSVIVINNLSVKIILDVKVRA